MRRLIALVIMLLAAWAPAAAQDAPDRYVAGQVWEYRTRAGDEDSLLKIHQIDRTPSGPVYHISLIGLAFGRGMPGGGEFGHMAVTRHSLDESVTRISPSAAAFPDPTEGIAQWRAASASAFDIPIAAIIDGVMTQIMSGGAKAGD